MKLKYLRDWGLENVTLDSLRAIFGQTPFFSAGGWNDANSWGVIESGKYDGLLYAGLFASNPDFVHRLKNGLPLTPISNRHSLVPLRTMPLAISIIQLSKNNI